MQIQQLRCLVEVAKEGSFSAAAKVLDLSQPAIGTQIRNLESNVGVSLVKRYARGMKLTREGEVLFEHAVQILTQINEARTAVQDSSEQVCGVVRLGATPVVAVRLMPQILERCSEIYPDLVIESVQGYSSELVPMMTDGQLNLSFSFDFCETDRVKVQPVAKEHLHLIGSPDVLGSQGADIRFSDLTAFDLIMERKIYKPRSAVEACARKAGVELRILIEVDPVQIRKEMLKKNRLCTVAPYGIYRDEIRRGELVGRPIVTPPVVMINYLLENLEDSSDMAQRAVKRIVLEEVRNLIDGDEVNWLPIKVLEMERYGVSDVNNIGTELL